MHDLYALKDKLIDELEEHGRKNLTESSLRTIDTLAHAAKNVSKVIECCEDDGYSKRNMSYADNSYYVRPDGSYNESYARGRGRGARRDSMGRYSSAGDISEDLRMLMNKTNDERVREEIRKLMDRV